MKNLWNNLKKLILAIVACIAIVFSGIGILTAARNIIEQRYEVGMSQYTAVLMLLLILLCSAGINSVIDLVEQRFIEKYDLRSKLPSTNRCTNCNCEGPKEVAGQEQGVCDRYRDSSD